MLPNDGEYNFLNPKKWKWKLTASVYKEQSSFKCIIAILHMREKYVDDTIVSNEIFNCQPVWPSKVLLFVITKNSWW